MYRVNLRMFPSTAAVAGRAPEQDSSTETTESTSTSTSQGPARLLHGDHGEYRRRKLGSEVEIKNGETGQDIFLKRENTTTKYHISIQRLARHDC